MAQKANISIHVYNDIYIHVYNDIYMYTMTKPPSFNSTGRSTRIRLTNRHCSKCYLVLTAMKQAFEAAYCR